MSVPCPDRRGRTQQLHLAQLGWGKKGVWQTQFGYVRSACCGLDLWKVGLSLRTVGTPPPGMLDLGPLAEPAAQPPRRVWVATRDSQLGGSCATEAETTVASCPSTSVTHASYPSGITNCSYGQSAWYSCQVWLIYIWSSSSQPGSVPCINTHEVGSLQQASMWSQRSWQQMIFCLSGRPKHFPGSPQLYLQRHSSQCWVLFWVQSWKPEPQHPGPLAPRGVQTASQLGRVGRNDLVVMSLCFAF